MTLIGFGCLHADDPGFNEDLWLECVETIQKTPLCWAFGLGDYSTLARSHYRNYVRAYSQDEDSQREIDALVKDQMRDFYKKYFKPLKGKLLGLAEGNHRWEFLNGTTSTQFLCELAEIPYWGFTSLHRLQFVHQLGSGIYVLKMLAHHGDWSAGGITPGGDLNSLERRAEGWDTDITWVAHTHRKMAYVSPVMTIPETGTLRIIERPRVYIRAGCFVRGYVPGCVTYAERKLLKPTELGWVTLKVQFYQPRDPEKTARLKAEGKSDRSAAGAVRYRFKVEF